MSKSIIPTDAIVSLLYTMENGTSAEIGVVGRDGVVKTECDRLLACDSQPQPAPD